MKTSRAPRADPTLILPLKVLLVEDNAADAELALAQLRNAGFEADWHRVDTEAAYRAQLHDGLDLVLSDFSLPGFSGSRALAVLKESGLDIPFILLSGTIGEEAAVAAIKQGAADYLMKDRMARLGTAVTQALAVTRRRRERRKADLAAQRQLAELRALFDLIPAMIWFKDTKGRILRVNQQVAKNAGKSVEEIEGRLSGETYPHEAAANYADDLEVMRSGMPKLGSIETLRDPAGRELSVQTDKVPVHDKQGQVTGIVVMAQDVTERKRAEQALRTSNEKFTQLADNIADAFWIRSPDLRELYYLSPAFERIWGRPVASLHANPQAWMDYILPEDRARVLAEFARLTQDGAAVDIEHRIVRPDGSIRWVRAREFQIRDADGKLIRHAGIATDITERKQAEDALGTSERRFKTLFEQAAVGVAQVEAATGRFVEVNQRFADLVGRSRQELGDLTIATLTYPPDWEATREKMQQVRTGAIREFACEKRYLRKDGAVVWAHLTASAMWVAGEEPSLCIGVVQDITARKMMEEQLRQAQKMEAIGTFAGGIAHDFNNILAAIGGYNELARLKLIDNPGVRGHLNSVAQAVQRAADLVRQILTFSREQPLERRVIRLQPVVAECGKLLRATLPPTIELNVEASDNAPTVLADETQVLRVLMNLGTNARQALGDRSGRLHLKVECCVVEEAHAAAHPRLRAGRYARVLVSDTGGGMSPEMLRRIFEPFFTTKGVGQGTGLGLAVVHGIMDSHDGIITVSSQPGEGTVFHLYFPAHLALALPAVPTGPRGHGERVLWVDDERPLVEFGRMALAALGYEVEAVMHPATALERVRAAPARFALVITDEMMPGMTGLQLAAELRQIRPDLPIILATGYSLTLTPERVKAAGIGHVLLKPATLEALGAAVRAALAGEPIAALATHSSS